jgi:hypothetical protein
MVLSLSWGIFGVDNWIHTVATTESIQPASPLLADGDYNYNYSRVLQGPCGLNDSNIAPGSGIIPQVPAGVPFSCNLGFSAYAREISCASNASVYFNSSPYHEVYTSSNITFLGPSQFSPNIDANATSIGVHTDCDVITRGCVPADSETAAGSAGYPISFNCSNSSHPEFAGNTSVCDECKWGSGFNPGYETMKEGLYNNLTLYAKGELQKFGWGSSPLTFGAVAINKKAVSGVYAPYAHYSGFDPPQQTLYMWCSMDVHNVTYRVNQGNVSVLKTTPATEDEIWAISGAIAAASYPDISPYLSTIMDEATLATNIDDFKQSYASQVSKLVVAFSYEPMVSAPAMSVVVKNTLLVARIPIVPFVILELLCLLYGGIGLALAITALMIPQTHMLGDTKDGQPEDAIIATKALASVDAIIVQAVGDYDYQRLRLRVSDTGSARVEAKETMRLRSTSSGDTEAQGQPASEGIPDERNRPELFSERYDGVQSAMTITHPGLRQSTTQLRRRKTL